ncbi:MAG: hypothetical protein HFF29_08635 [Oscillospiraceae bacterium]|nr:hypothetical protein [Oscillospiraceae bacterium]
MDFLPGEAQFGEHAGAEVFDEHVRIFDELPQQFLALGVFEIQGDVHLVAVFNAEPQVLDAAHVTDEIAAAGLLYLSAEEAERIGLIEKVVDDGTVLEAALEMAGKIKAKGPVAVMLAKMAINVGANTDLLSGLYFERYSQALAFSTEDKAEGTLAFIEKRPASFKGM